MDHAVYVMMGGYLAIACFCCGAFTCLWQNKYTYASLEYPTMDVTTDIESSIVVGGMGDQHSCRMLQLVESSAVVVEEPDCGCGNGEHCCGVEKIQHQQPEQQVNPQQQQLSKLDLHDSNNKNNTTIGNNNLVENDNFPEQ